MKPILQGLLFATMTAAVGNLSAQTTLISDNFDPPINSVKWAYGYGDNDAGSSSSAVVSGVGVGGTAAWEIVNSSPSGSAGYSGAAGEYQASVMSGNTSPNLSDYVLSFDAMASDQGENVSVIIQTWPQPDFGGSQTGQISTGVSTPNLSLNTSYTHYDLNLGDTSIFTAGSSSSINPTDGTWQIVMQLNDGGPTPYTHTVNIDNLQVTMVPEPSTLTMCIVGALGGLTVFRRRKG